MNEILEYINERIKELESSAEEHVQELEDPEGAVERYAAAQELRDLKTKFFA